MLFVRVGVLVRPKELPFFHRLPDALAKSSALLTTLGNLATMSVLLMLLR